MENIKKKALRVIAGFTFCSVENNPDGWYRRALSFKNLVDLIVKNCPENVPFPYYYNAGISLELILKAIMVAQQKKFTKNHNLQELAQAAQVTLTKNQYLTLELLEEIIKWSGRYPTPTQEKYWDKYYDEIMEKHICRSLIGTTAKVMKNKETFPTSNNYFAIYAQCEKHFHESLKKSG